MSLSIGIVGLPNVGKSTLFKALTKKPVDISNYPFCTVEPNVGVVEVQDERLEKLAEISKPQKVVPAIIKFVDVAGLVKGASKGEGLGNQFLAHLRECDVLLHIVRCFANENIAHIDGTVNPQRDIEVVENELRLKDLETIEKRLQKIEKDVKQSKKGDRAEFEILKIFEQHLNQAPNKPLTNRGDRIHLLNEKGREGEVIHNLFLLTIKPQIYLFNCSEREMPTGLKRELEEQGKDWLQLDLREELDKTELSKDERKELGLEEPGLDQLIKKCYKILKTITFFTIVGKEEARAWPIKQGSTILEGAGRVHSDFKEKFVRAEVINWQKLYEVGSWKKAGELGLLRTVGREYILQEGDVVEIKI